jgi:hypothetical protein
MEGKPASHPSVLARPCHAWASAGRKRTSPSRGGHVYASHLRTHRSYMRAFSDRTGLSARVVLSCMSDAVSGLGSDSRVLASTITKGSACAWFGMCWISRRCGIGCHRAVFRVWLLAGLRPAFRAAAEAEAELCLTASARLCSSFSTCDLDSPRGCGTKVGEVMGYPSLTCPSLAASSCTATGRGWRSKA